MWTLLHIALYVNNHDFGKLRSSTAEIEILFPSFYHFFCLPARIGLCCYIEALHTTNDK